MEGELRDGITQARRSYASKAEFASKTAAVKALESHLREVEAAQAQVRCS